MIKLFVGLGSPGTEYQGTRHNAGLCLDRRALAQDFKSQLGRRPRTSTAWWPLRHGHTVWLLKPQTYMNLSGNRWPPTGAVFKIAPEHLGGPRRAGSPAGQVKLKLGGGHAGHNGLRDIHAQLGSAQYWRLRLGHRPPRHQEQVSAWVLQNHPPSSARRPRGRNLTRLTAVPALIGGDMPRHAADPHPAGHPDPNRPNRPDRPPQPATCAKSAPATPTTRTAPLKSVASGGIFATASRCFRRAGDQREYTPRGRPARAAARNGPRIRCSARESIW